VKTLHETFEYKNGELWRREYTDKLGRTYKSKKINCIANDTHGYCTVSFSGKVLKYHRIVWELVNGPISSNIQIDHINGNRIDNRLENLRLVTNRENCQNQTRHREGKLVGVFLHKPTNTWNARIYINGKSKSLGYYKTEQDAHQAYVNFLKTIECQYVMLTHILSQRNIPVFFQIVEDNS
jgi:hypothetical protein